MNGNPNNKKLLLYVVSMTCSWCYPPRSFSLHILEPCLAVTLIINDHSITLPGRKGEKKQAGRYLTSYP